MPSIHPKHAPADHEILDVIRERWSPRAFDAAREVSRADLLRLFEAARWAPSSCNEQPWRFVVTRAGTPPDVRRAVECARRNPIRPGRNAAPVLVLVAAVFTRAERTGKRRCAV